MLRIAAILTTVAVAVFMAWVIGQSITGWEAVDEPRIDLAPDDAPPHLQPGEEATTLDQMPNPGSGEREWVQRIDPETHRVTQEFFYARMDPLPDGQYKVEGQIARSSPQTTVASPRPIASPSPGGSPGTWLFDCTRQRRVNAPG